ncbi:MAG: hypothetical protein IJZ08_01345 [Clostridia bacterium]|nr:hypothetical protein [Clostridia bacterium]
MSGSGFYTIAIRAINAETARLDAFCEALDKNPTEKKQQIVEYKRAKYRYAGVTNVWCAVYNAYRTRARNAATHYLPKWVDAVFVRNSAYVSLYENAADDEKPDYALYYGASALAEEKIADLSAKIPLATDWERVELEERLGGLRFAKSCMDEAWEQRKDVIG